MEHLDGDIAIVPEIVGTKDRRHPAGTKLTLDAVAIGQRGG
jgi:hypothetical protein